MSSVNRVHLIGNCGRDPEVKYTAQGSAVCNLTLATSRKWKNKQTGDMMEETEWHRVVLYERLAEIAGEYVKKGKSVYIEGRLKTRKWTDKDGIEKYTTEIVAESLQLLGSKDEGQQRPSQQKPIPQAQRGGQSKTGFDDMDDDIPF